MSVLVIERPGMLTTVQDAGRHRFAEWGVPRSGPMDAWSARLANRLVGNADAAPVIEVTLMGPQFRCGRACQLAVTGAEFDVEVDGRRLRSPFVTTVASGGVVNFADRHAGARAYVAIDGSWRLPAVLGSVATLLRSPFAGVAGRPLRAGDEIPLGAARPGRARSLGGDAFRTWWTGPDRGGVRTLRVLPHANADGASAVRALCSTTFLVSPRSDRMGYRLEGQADWPELPGSLLSSPTTLGAVQVPPGAEPILLMADHQTTGGYAQVAVLCRADRQIAGQLAPGDRLRFEGISLDTARAAHKERERLLDGVAPEAEA